MFLNNLVSFKIPFSTNLLLICGKCGKTNTDSAFWCYTSVIKTQKFASIDATCVFSRDKTGRPEQLLQMALSDGQRSLSSLQGIISRLSAVGPSLLRTNNRLCSYDTAAIGPVRNLCTYMLITHLFLLLPPQQQHVETSLRPTAVWIWKQTWIWMHSFWGWFCSAQLIVFMNVVTFFRKARTRCVTPHRGHFILIYFIFTMRLCRHILL